MMEPLIEKLPGNTGGNITAKKSKAWIYLLIPVALIAAIWIWKEVQISSIKKQAETDRVRIQEQAAQHIIQTNVEHLRLLAIPFVWSVRSEMLQGNLSQVHLYLNEMVKEKNFKSITVADDKGKIVSSTDKKFEGQPFAAVGKESYLSASTTMIDQTNDSTFVVSSPVMGFNNRLGTLMFTYTIATATFK